MSEELIRRVADRIEERMGPVFGSPEYLADPVKLARAEKRRRDSAEAFARIAVEEAIDAMRNDPEAMLTFTPITNASELPE
jgi:hypothetical protein